MKIVSTERLQGPAWSNRKAETSCKEPANQPLGHPAQSQGHGTTVSEALHTMATRNAASAFDFTSSEKSATLPKCATVDSALKKQPARHPKALADPEQATATRSSATFARIHALGATVLLCSRGNWGPQSTERLQGPAWSNRKAETSVNTSCKEPANQPLGHPAPSQGHGTTVSEALHTMATRNATRAFTSSKKSATLPKCATVDSVPKKQPARHPKALADPEQATKTAPSTLSRLSA